MFSKLLGNLFGTKRRKTHQKRSKHNKTRRLKRKVKGG